MKSAADAGPRADRLARHQASQHHRHQRVHEGVGRSTRRGGVLEQKDVGAEPRQAAEDDQVGERDPGARARRRRGGSGPTRPRASAASARIGLAVSICSEVASAASPGSGRRRDQSEPTAQERQATRSPMRPAISAAPAARAPPAGRRAADQRRDAEKAERDPDQRRRMRRPRPAREPGQQRHPERHGGDDERRLARGDPLLGPADEAVAARRARARRPARPRPSFAARGAARRAGAGRGRGRRRRHRSGAHPPRTAARSSRRSGSPGRSSPRRDRAWRRPAAAPRATVSLAARRRGGQSSRRRRHGEGCVWERSRSLAAAAAPGRPPPLRRRCAASAAGLVVGRRLRQLGLVALDEAGVVVAADERRVAHHAPVKGQVRLDAADVVLAERAPHAIDRRARRVSAQAQSLEIIGS